MERARHQADLRLPRPQLRRRRARRPVDPGAAQHRRRALPGHHAPVVQARAPTTRSTSTTHAVGVDKFEAYVMGEEDGVAEVAGVGGAHLRRPGPHHQGPGRRVGEQAHHRRHRQRRPRHPRPLRHRAGPPAGHLPGHAGPGQAGLQPGQDDRVGPVRQARPVRPAQAAARAVPAQGLHRRPPGRDQPPVVHPQDLRAQGHPRGRVRLVGLRVRDRRPRQTSSCTTSTRPTAAPRSTWSGPTRRRWITCWNAGNDYVRPCATPTSSSCSRSTRGSRTTACWPTSSSP